MMNLQNKQKTYRQRLYKAKTIIKNCKKTIIDLMLWSSNCQTVEPYLKEAGEQLHQCFQDVPHLLMRRYLKNVQNETTTHEKYPPPLRQFAGILQFYSTKAYEFVRETFSLSLPHIATIREWTSNIECNPG